MKTFSMNFADSDLQKSAKNELDLLAGLNQRQKEAVEFEDGPLLIIAGAGSGKTRVLTHRIAHLLAKRKARASNILALTFTNKAAREMRERIEKLIGDEARRLWMGTFHSVFSKILRMEAEKIGYSADFSIWDTEDSKKAVTGIMKSLGLSAQDVKPNLIRNSISKAKNGLVSPTEFQDKFIQSSVDDIVGQIYPRYEALLRQSNAMDFDDLLLKPIDLFQQHADVLEAYQDRFRYILVDEYQDTNHAQYTVTALLAGKHQNLCVVGDDAQSIYSFRGADIRNILDFKKDYPAAKEISLEQNYRSTKVILKAADSVIKNNKNQLEKSLWTKNELGSAILVLENNSDRDEAGKAANYLHHLKVQNGFKNADFAILYRTNSQSRLFEESLRKHGIPYQLVGGISFYQRKEVKDVMAYLKILVNPNDQEALLRVINEPTRGIGQKTLDTALDLSRQNNLSLWDVFGRIDQTDVYKPAKNSINKFVDSIGKAKSRLGTESLVDTTRFLLKEIGYMQQYQEETDEAFQRRDNIDGLLSALSEHENQTEGATLSTFLQEISLMTDLDQMEDAANTVTLMTVHASKGLEFPVVFLVGLEEELFPMGGGNRDVDVEEERRLFYVAVTRAEERLFLSFAKSRVRFGEDNRTRPSRFLNEIDTSLLRTESGGSWQAKAAIKTPSSHQFQDYDWRSSKSQHLGSKNDSETEAQVHYEPESIHDFQVGVKVFHQKFGPGKIQQMQGQSGDTRVTVFFPSVGQKKLILRYAKLSILK